jgi:hypothetical protein
MERLEKRVRRDAAAARVRSLTRRVSGILWRKYLDVVPSVFSACGEFAAFRLRMPPRDALEALRERAILTLDSATALLGGFRFSRNDNVFAYLPVSEDLHFVESSGIGTRRPGSSFPLGWAPPGWTPLFAVVPRALPPYRECQGFRVVTTESLVRDLIGFYGARADLLARIEERLVEKGV